MPISPQPPDDPGLHKLLRELPTPKAPDSLVDRVLSRINERNRALVWWQQPITRWPMPARGMILGVSALVVGVCLLLIDPGASPLNSLLGSIENTPGWGATRALSDAAQSLLRTIPSSVWWSLGTVAIGSYLCCVGVGGWFYRQWLGGGRGLKTWGDAWL